MGVIAPKPSATGVGDGTVEGEALAEGLAADGGDEGADDEGADEEGADDEGPAGVAAGLAEGAAARLAEGAAEGLADGKTDGRSESADLARALGLCRAAGLARVVGGTLGEGVTDGSTVRQPPDAMPTSSAARAVCRRPVHFTPGILRSVAAEMRR